ncbi:prolyl oligopeptidase family serine peptidase [Algoriphagus litoralis]|uniref:prolyl oligopeptidase family serine peptidase n=1 Tax=Algoriphagus litoralis TaxID=2202829 RepID=UPI000DB96C64|nr:prolyl oligopeptidase family serine peptidase [Algoriphagus litoralis]
MIKTLKLILFLLCIPILGFSAESTAPEPAAYKLVIEGFDWGPAVSKVILPVSQNPKELNPADFEIFVSRSSSLGEIPAALTSGKRSIVYGYPSDENGNRMEEGKHMTLVLAVSPVQPIGSPIQYLRMGNRASNVWIDYSLTVLHAKSGQIWNKESGRIRPIVDEFDLTGTFTHDNTSLTYAAFAPKSIKEKAPLIIWLHGGGEGGTDPTIAMMGNKAYNYASPEIQVLFDGAFVLIPQTPTFWMDSGEGMTRGQVNDIYNGAVFALIQDYVAKNPQIDPTRIYVGGCSNGGYISLKLILEHPDYFAAGYISALAYNNEFISDAQIQKIKNVPMWFVHAKDDNTTKPDETVVPLYHRLKQAGAKNVFFSYHDNVTDITGFYGGDDFRYNGHWSWIYSHANVARTDFDGSPVLLNGRPVTIMEWMAAQKKKK